MTRQSDRKEFVSGQYMTQSEIEKHLKLATALTVRVYNEWEKNSEVPYTSRGNH